MSEPTAGGSTEIGKAHYSVELKDNTDKGLSDIEKKIQKSSTSTRRMIQENAQVARNSISVITRSVGSNVANTVLEPIVSIGESFLRVAEDVELSGGRIQKTVKGIQVVSGGLLGVGVGLSLLGGREKQAADQLNNSIEDLGLSSADYGEHIEEVIGQQEKFGRTSIQTMQALQLLTSATHDPTAALDDMGEVADLAASRHLNLDQAARQVAITIGGGGRLLKQYNIDVIKNTDGTRNYAAMNAKLADVLHGQAAAAADNFGGKIKALGVEVEDSVAKFGEKWGPAISLATVPLLVLSTAVDIFSTVKASRLAKAAATVAAATEAEAGAAAATTASIVANLEEQTAAAETAAGAFLDLSSAAGAEGAAAALAGAAGAGSAGLTGAAGGAAAGVGVAEQGIIAETGRMQAFWDEVMANMSADMAGSAQSIIAYIESEQASLTQFQVMFNEAFASMAAAAGGSTAEQIAALGALQVAQDETAVSSVALGAAETEAAVGGLAAMTAALGPLMLGAAALGVVIGAVDLATHDFGGHVGAAVPPMEALTQAIKDNYGEVNNLTIHQIDASAASNGMLASLNDLGISTREFNDAVSKGPKAVSELADKISMQTLLNSKLKGSFDIMGKGFDDHEHQVDYLKTSYEKWAEATNKTIRMAKAEEEAISNLTPEQVEQAKALHLTTEEYATLLTKITDKTGKQSTEAEMNAVTIASNEDLQAVLNITAGRYNDLTQNLLESISANQRYAASMQGVESVHAFLDPALDAYHAWINASQQVKDAQKQEADSAEQAAHAVTQAKAQEAAAEQNVIDVAKQGRKSIKDAEADIVTAHQDAADKISSANQKVIDAELAAKDATEKVTEARKAADAQIIESIRTLRDMAEGEQKARDDLLSAQLDAQQKAHDAAQDALNSSVGLTQQQLIDQQKLLDDQQAQILKQRNEIAARASKNSVTDAQKKLNDLLQDDINKRKEAQKVIRQGVNGNPSVVKALKDQRDAEEAITKAKKDQIKVEKEAQKEISDAVQKLSDVRKKAAKDNAAAIKQEQDAEYSLKQAQDQQANSAMAAKRAMDQANLSLETSRLKLTEVEAQTGQTDGSLKNLQKTMAKMDKGLTLKYQAQGVKATGQATVLLQRAIEETLLEAGGATPAEARRKALHDIPNWGDVSSLGTGPRSGPGGGAGGRTPVTSFTGGEIRGPGGPTSDDIHARLSNGEHVWTAAEVQAAGGHETVRRMRQAALEGAIQAFAAGGPVNAIGPVIDSRRMKIVDRLKNSGMLSMLGSGYRGSNKYADFNIDGWGNIGEVLSFIRSADSHPYVYGAVGPGAYDCSGLVGEVWARLTNHPSYKRYFTTGNEANFFEPGPGLFTVGVTNNNNTQHTAGRLRGLKFEARDTAEGIIVGSQAKSPESFAHVYHLKEARGFPTGPGGGTGDVGASGHLDPAAARRAGMTLMPSGWSWGDLNNVFNRESGWRWDATGSPTPMGRAYGIPQSLPGSKMRSSGSDWHDNAVTQIKWGMGYIRDRYGNPTRARQHEDAFNWYDDGGFLPPGPSLVMNGTGKPEPVFTSDQLKDIANNQGIHIDKLTFEVDVNKIDDIHKLVEILNQLPQAIRQQKAGSIRKVSN